LIPEIIEEKDFVYNKVPNNKVQEFYRDFCLLLDDFSNTVKFKSELEINIPAVIHICTRVDQRKDYYMYYHSKSGKIMRMSHEKEMGLWAYWVSKYKPVRFAVMADERTFFLQNGCSVSDAFAAYIIISIVCSNNESRAKYFTSKRVEHLYYDLSNRDFCKEAIISRIEDLIA
jgi:hypothetical protein